MEKNVQLAVVKAKKKEKHVSGTMTAMLVFTVIYQPQPVLHAKSKRAGSQNVIMSTSVKITVAAP